MRIILADVVPKNLPKPDLDRHFAELTRLIETLGGMTIVKIVQKRGNPSGKTYIGTGKAEEIGEMARELKIDAVVINGKLKGSQLLELTRKIPVLILDRVDVILRIFGKHAKTSEAKLQIKRAQLEYDIPKIYGRAATTLFERERGGGVTQRGAGEKGIELEKRHIIKQIKQIDQKIESLKKTRDNQRKNRRRQDFITLALVGYTNSGKSTLLKSLTRKDVYIADELFATLDSRIGDLYLPTINKKVLIADTIGFIADLPPMLIASFLATLEEAQDADVLLHVIDASDTDSERQRKIITVNEILHELHCDQKPQIIIANKVDLTNEEAINKLIGRGYICVSAIKKEGLEKLSKKIEKTIDNIL